MLKKGEILYDGLFSVDINIKEINSDAPYVIFGIVNTNNPSNNKSLFSIQNITSAMCVEENSGYFSFSWTSDVILGDNFDYYLNVYDLKDNKLVVRVPYMMGNNETVSSNKLEKDVWHQKARVFFENTSCDDYYYAQIEATDGLKSLVSNKYRFTWDDQQATLDWYKADDISMQINGVNVSTNNNLVFGIQHMEPLPEPLEVTLSYTAELPNSIKELPTVLFMEKVNTRSNGASDKFVFYPVNTGVSCNITDSNSLSDSLDKDTCTYTYKTDIYTSIKPNELYELTYKVYPELESDIISKEAIQDGRKYIKILSTKIKFSSQTLFNSEFIDRDVSEFYNSFTNKNVITRNVNPSELRNISDKEMVAIRNTKTPLKIKVPTKIMEDDVAINDVDPNINRKINRRNAKITDVDPSSILISEDSDDLYVQKNKVIKKLISFDKVIEEQEINSENIIGDIELVDVDDTLSYIFQIKEKRRFLGINIGDKIVYKTMNAIEDIN